MSKKNPTVNENENANVNTNENVNTNVNANVNTNVIENAIKNATELFNREILEIAEINGTLDVKVDTIRVSDENVVRGIESAEKDAEKWAFFKSSIQSKGLLDPLTVYLCGYGSSSLDKLYPKGTLSLVNGLRRYTALQQLGIDHAKIRIYMSMSDLELKDVGMVSNVQRFAMTKNELKTNILFYVNQKIPFTDISNRLGVSKLEIERWIGIASLPDDVQELVIADTMPITTAMDLVKAKRSKKFSEEDFDDLVEKAKTEKSSEFKGILDRELTERSLTQEKKKKGHVSEYVHVPSLDKDRCNEYFRKAEFLLESIVADNREATGVEQKFIDTMNYLFTNTKEDITAGRIDFDSKAEEKRVKAEAAKADKASKDSVK